MGFDILGLSDTLLTAVKDAGYEQPTPIQRQAIPTVLQGHDVLGIAQTGTGKTASFTLPMIDILSMGNAKARMPRSLILEPTRELAAQVSENFETYGKNHKLSMALLIGGVSFAEQEKKLDRGVDVLIATPGRLLDHFERGKLMLNGVQILVIDEADRMLDMGFIPDVEKICKLMPQKHQTLFFSATMPKEIKQLTDRFLTDPKTIEVAPPASPAETVDQKLVVIGPRDKPKTLRNMINEEKVTTAIIFCNRKKDVRSVTTMLKRNDFDAAQLHGDLSQPERMDILKEFKDGNIRLLVASDVAARGLDIPRVNHIFNYDVPEHADDYIHRIGRTGRAGREGTSITLALPSDGKYVQAIERMLKKEIQRCDIPGVKSRSLDTDSPKQQQSKGEDKSEPRKSDDKPKPDSPPQQKGKSANLPDKSPARTSGQQPRRKSDDNTKAAQADESGKRKPQKSKGKDEPIIGLGDHVPAFLARPIPEARLKRAKAGNGDSRETKEA